MTGLADLATGPLGLVFRATLVLLVALLLDRGLRSVAAISRHVLWVVTTVALLVLPVLQVELPRLRVPGWRTAAVQDETLLAEPVVIVASESAAGGDEWVTARDIVLPTVGPVHRAPTMPFDVALILLWVTGGAVLLVALARGIRRARRAVAEAIPVENRRLLLRLEHARRLAGVRRAVALGVSDGIRTPMTGGVRRPIILLPMDAADWSENRLDTVLCHEMVHVRRFDAVHQLASRVVVAAYWFHPLAWQGARRAAAAREEACDETVLELGTRPSHYARHLVDLAEHGMSLPSFPALARLHHPNLEDRIMAILRLTRAPASPRRTALAATVLLGWTALVAAASPADAQRPTRAPRAPTVAMAPAAPVAPIVEVAPEVSWSVPVPAPPADAPAVPLPLSPREAPAAPAMPTVVTMNDGADCEQDGSGYRVSSDGESGPVQMVSTTRGDLRICLAIRGRSTGSTNVIPTGVLPRGVSMTLQTNGPSGTQRLETVGGDRVNTYHWFVNGRERPFDAKAEEWRDAVIALIRSDNEQGRVSGRVAEARGGSDRARLRSQGGAVEVAMASPKSWVVVADSVRVKAADLAGRQAALAESQAVLVERLHRDAARERAAMAEVVVANQARAVELRARAAVLDSVRVMADTVMVRSMLSRMRDDTALARVRSIPRRDVEVRLRDEQRRAIEARAVDVARLRTMADSVQRATVRLDRQVSEVQARARLEAAREAELQAVTVARPRLVIERQAADRAAEARLRAAIEQVGPR